MREEINIEIKKMIETYEDMALEFNQFLKEEENTDSTLDSSAIKPILTNIQTLNASLDEIIKTSQFESVILNFDNLITSMDAAINSISGQVHSNAKVKIDLLLEKSREFHCIQWDYYETFEELLKDLSTHH